MASPLSAKIPQILKNLPMHPGVYQMLDAKGKILYVGKARNLKRRVSSYFQKQDKTPKTQALVSQISDIEVIQTPSDVEALLLENNLIKTHRPRYNIYFRDDKSYPFIYLSDHPDFPSLDYVRGQPKKKGRYFGPFPSSGAVRETLKILQKLFRIRQCSDTFFSNRTRPCLQYQIQRCTAPCVGYVTKEAYEEDLKLAILFLEGKDQKIIETLIVKMEKASEKKAYELAAFYRDQIANLRKVASQQNIVQRGGDCDVVGLAQINRDVMVQVMMIRKGQVLGSKPYFLKVPLAETRDNIMAAFIGQYYMNPVRQHQIPPEILLSDMPFDVTMLASLLSKTRGIQVHLSAPKRGRRVDWLKMANQNAHHSLGVHLNHKLSMENRFESLKAALELDAIPSRIECFDVSHSKGEACVASCVVFNREGPVKQAYRLYKIKEVTPGDDYGALRHALMRRYKQMKTKDAPLPDLLLIDGGKGQLHVAEESLEACQVSGVWLMGIAKGAGRKPGLETLFLSGRLKGIHLPEDSPALHLLQQIRDEAHRFAITRHRAARAKAKVHSPLEGIEGVGPKRRQLILQYFGGLQGAKLASIKELAKVPGISVALARHIFDALHQSGT